jgi:hypothetical protein
MYSIYVLNNIYYSFAFEPTQLPPSFSAQAENIHVPQSAVAGGPIEKSSSTYDSLCVNSIIVSLLFIKTFES